MKKAIITAGVALAAIALFPAGVSAQSYSEQGYDSENSMSWNQDRCDRIDARLYRLNAMFDQEKTHKLARQQRLIDRQNNIECPVTGSIVDTLASNGNFTTLVAAVQAAGLVDTLSAAGELTVFAPTDQAFANLPAGTIEALLADKEALTNVLTNHVLAGKVDSETALEVGQAQALSGNMLSIEYGYDDVPYVNDSRLLLTDIQTTNGVVHVIDAVLVP